MSTPDATAMNDIAAEMASGGFTKAIGLRIVELTPDRAVVEVDVTPQLLQPYGIVHGGVHCALVETAASFAAAAWLGADGKVVGVSNHTDFLRPARGGRLTATATPVHRGRLQQLWAVDVTGDDGRSIARGQLRVQNLTADHLDR